MKNIIKKYYELADETKEILFEMNLFHEIENQISVCDNKFLDNLGDEEKLLEIAMTCSYLTILDASEIIKRLIEILNCRDISLDDIINLTTEELIEMISNIDDVKDKKNPNIHVIKKFMYNNENCLFLKDEDNGKYLILYKKSKDDSKVYSITFNNLEDLISLIVDVNIDYSECENADGT